MSVHSLGTLGALSSHFDLSLDLHAKSTASACGDIRMQPHVDTLGENRRANEVFDRTHQKAILRRYRVASREIFAVLSRLAPLCEKAGIDEAFLDLTQQAHERLAQMVGGFLESRRAL